MATLRQKLDDLTRRFIPSIRSAFIAAMRDIQDSAVIKEVIDAIRMGDVDLAVRRTGISPAAMRPITAEIERAFETGGVTVIDSLPKRLSNSDGRVVIRFDVRDSRAERLLRDHSSALVTRITDDTRQAARNFLQAGMQRGDNPRTMALDLIGRIDPTTGKRVGGLIGLTPGQERWSARTEQMLRTLDKRYFTRTLRDKRFDRTVMAAIRDDKPLSDDVISKLMTRYRDNVLRYRGEVIARTETIQMLNAAEHEAIKQSVDSGAVRASDVQRIWDATGDDRTRHSHMEMDGQTVGLDEPFTFPDGSQAMFPGDTSLGAPAEETIQCRCRARMRINFAASVIEKYKGNIDFGDDNEDVDEELRQYVLNNGMRENREFLAAYDSRTGQIIDRNSGSKSHVGVSDELRRLMGDKNQSIIVHHNHPSSSSFSKQDIQMIMNNPGLKGLWAHGHNQSSYYAERGEKSLTEFALSKAQEESRRTIQEMVNSRQITPNEAGLIYNHHWMNDLHSKKLIKYQSELNGETLAAWEKI